MGEPLGWCTGGSAGLRRLLEEHGEAIEADLERFYRIRLSSALTGEEDGKGRYSARELLNRIHQLPPESALVRKLRGPMAVWGLEPLLLRQIAHLLAGANWQRSGGKGQKPTPVDLPDRKGRGGTPSPSKPSGADVAQRLQNLGLIPAGTSD